MSDNQKGVDPVVGYLNVSEKIDRGCEIKRFNKSDLRIFVLRVPTEIVGDALEGFARTGSRRTQHQSRSRGLGAEIGSQQFTASRTRLAEAAVAVGAAVVRRRRGMAQENKGFRFRHPLPRGQPSGGSHRRRAPLVAKNRPFG